MIPSENSGNDRIATLPRSETTHQVRPGRTPGDRFLRRTSITETVTQSDHPDQSRQSTLTEVPLPGQEGMRARRHLFIPAPYESRRSFMPTARWEGAVVEVFNSYFVGDVIDLDSGEQATVEFDLNEVSPSDLPLCEPGSLFYWTVGYESKESGQRTRSSSLFFRRAGRTATLNAK